MKFVLASRSVARKEVLSTMIDDFEVIESNFDESTIIEKNPRTLVKKLSKAKCQCVFDLLSENRCVIAADTVVYINNQIKGKPKDKEDAKRTLKLISGNRHKVYTGVCIKILKDDLESEFNFVNASTVFFKKLTDEEIDKYIKTGEPMDKAGCYAIQGKAAKFVEKVNGSLSSAIGLPIAQIYEVLRQESLI